MFITAFPLATGMAFVNNYVGTYLDVSTFASFILCFHRNSCGCLEIVPNFSSSWTEICGGYGDLVRRRHSFVSASHWLAFQVHYSGCHFRGCRLRECWHHQLHQFHSRQSNVDSTHLDIHIDECSSLRVRAIYLISMYASVWCSIKYTIAALIPDVPEEVDIQVIEIELIYRYEVYAFHRLSDKITLWISLSTIRW